MEDDPKNSNQDLLIGIVVWAFFSIAVMRGLEFFDLKSYIRHLLMPGILFYLFLFYWLLKSDKFLKYWRFLLSILTISLIFHITELVIIKYVRLSFREDDLLRLLMMLIVSVVMSSVLYLISLIVKKVSKI